MEDDRTTDNTTRNVIIGLIIVALIVLLLFATGMLDLDSEGEFEAPEVSVEGGQLPETDLEAADVDIGTTTTTTEVPELEVDTTNVTTETPTIDVDPVE